MTTPAGLLLAPLLLLMAGCTTVRIYNASVTEEKYPGLLVLKVLPLPGATLTASQDLGLKRAQRSDRLGYLNESVFAAPDASGCRWITARTLRHSALVLVMEQGKAF